jgi:ASC-1-like (ASCH) protein
MGLYDIHLNHIKSGNKTIEVRLNDEKRRKINVGDAITFIKIPEDGEKIKTKVLKLETFPSFKEMFEQIPWKAMGARGTSIDEMVENTYKIYTPEQEEKYGTMAITLEYLGEK